MSPIASPVPPNLRAVLDGLTQEIFDSLNCHAVGRIVKFDSAKQTASIQIGMLKQFPDRAVPYPLLTDCPVVVLSGGLGSLTFPISPGDTCLVFFNDKDLDNWFSTGNEVLPNTQRKHSLSDGIALVGIRTRANPLSDYDMTAVRLRHPSLVLEGNVKVTSGASGIFTSADGKTITVVDGIVINIV